MEETVSLVQVADLAKRGEAWAIDEALQVFARRHNEKAIDFILDSTLREGGLWCAITLAELPCPRARDYIRDLAGLIRLADRGILFAKEDLQAYKDYGPECRERILRLG